MLCSTLILSIRMQIKCLIIFAAEAIDGDVFPDLSLDELRKMGCPLGYAKKIFRLVEAQRGTPVCH